MGYVLLFGNEMLLTSFFASSLITITVSTMYFSYSVVNRKELTFTNLWASLADDKLMIFYLFSVEQKID